MAEPGEELAALLRGRLVELLTGTAEALSAELAALPPEDPPWPQPGVGESLLAALDTLNPPDPMVGAVLHLLSGTLQAPTGDADLHGWAPAGGGARGIAYAVRAGTGAGDLAAALVSDGDAVALVASGTSAAAVRVDLAPGWSVAVAGSIAGRLTVRFRADGPLEATGSPGDTVTLAFSRSDPGVPDAGSDPGPAVRLGAVDAAVTVTVRGDGTPAVTGSFATRGGSVTLAPGGIAALVPGFGPVPLDVDLRLDPAAGIRLAGSTTLRTSVSVSLAVPGAVVGPLDVWLAVGPGGSLGVGIAARFAVELPGVPIRVATTGVGLAVPFSLGDGGAFGLAVPVPAEPDGAGVDLALPVVQGAGALHRGSTGGYSGLLALTIPPMSAAAFGVLTMDPLSFLVVIGATFPPPGVQVGFGLAVTGVGGIVGVGRRVDARALAQAVSDGTAADLLFAPDPQAHADRVVQALPAIFPAAPGRVVVGPMFQLSWGGRIVSASCALVLELPAPVKVTLLGVLRMALPDPEAPLVDIRVTIVGQVDTGEPSVWFLASLAGSSLVGIPLTGDLYLLSRGGDDPQFVLSAGGFHPAYTPPRGVPALRRLALDLSSGFLQLRAQAYFALTSNTIQFGARLDLVAEVAGCGLRGFLAFDVLVQFEPFRFVADLSAGIAVQAFGETLAGISLALALEGPAAWRARGTGRIELLFFGVSIDFDTTWGDPAPQPLATPPVAEILQAAFADRAAWTARPPDLSRSPVALSAAARSLLAQGTAVHPHGQVVGRQKRVPLGITLERFERTPIPAQRWDVADPMLADGVAADLPEEVREEFSAAAYLALPDDEQLSRPAFEPFRAGLSFSSDRVVVPPARPLDLAWETKVIDDAPTVAPTGRMDGFAAVLAAAAMIRADHPAWWQPPAERVTEVAQRYLPADTWSLAAATDLMPLAATFSEARQAVRSADAARRVTVVEAWEVGS